MPGFKCFKKFLCRCSKKEKKKDVTSPTNLQTKGEDLPIMKIYSENISKQKALEIAWTDASFRDSTPGIQSLAAQLSATPKLYEDVIGCVDTARKLLPECGSETIINLFEEYDCYTGIFLFLHPLVEDDQDPDVIPSCYQVT